MDKLVRYQETKQELSRQVRRELAKSGDQVNYITGSTLVVQGSMAGIQTKGTCIMVQAAASSQALIKAAEFQGVSPVLIEILIQQQLQFLIRMSQVADIGSRKLLRMIEQLPTLSSQSFLDWLERFVNDYYK